MSTWARDLFRNSRLSSVLGRIFPIVLTLGTVAASSDRARNDRTTKSLTLAEKNNSPLLSLYLPLFFPLHSPSARSLRGYVTQRAAEEMPVCLWKA